MMPIMTAYNILPALSLAKILIKNKNAATEAHTATTMIISETMCLLSSKPIVKLLSSCLLYTSTYLMLPGFFLFSMYFGIESIGPGLYKDMPATISSKQDVYKRQYLR